MVVLSIFTPGRSPSSSVEVITVMNTDVRNRFIRYRIKPVRYQMTRPFLANESGKHSPAIFTAKGKSQGDSVPGCRINFIVLRDTSGRDFRFVDDPERSKGGALSG